MSDQSLLPALPPQQPQRQDSLSAQLRDLHDVAVRLGMYDAATWLTWKLADRSFARNDDL